MLGLTVLQTLNSLLGAVAVVLLYSIAHELLADQLDAVLLAALFALSGTWWRFATDADAYVAPIVLLLICCRLLLPGQPARPLLVALVHTGAMLFHELAVLFVVPAAVGLYWQTRGNRRAVVEYLALTFGFTSAAYFTCFYWVSGRADVEAYLRWITWHTPDSSFAFSVARNAWLTIRGTVRLALGGKISAFHPRLVELGSVITLVAIGAGLVPREEDRPAGPRFAAWFLWVWIFVYVGFLFFWMPQNTFYRLFYLPPVVLLAGIGLRQWGGRRALYAAVALIGTWNFLFYIYPDSLVETTRWYARPWHYGQSGSPEPGFI